MRGIRFSSLLLAGAAVLLYKAYSSPECKRKAEQFKKGLKSKAMDMMDDMHDKLDDTKYEANNRLDKIADKITDKTYEAKDKMQDKIDKM